MKSRPQVIAEHASARAPRAVAGSRFAIVSNGFVDGPAQALRDYLLERGASYLLTVFHPLLPGEPAVHEESEWREGQLVRRRRIPLPSRPPLTYPLDLVVPLLPSPVDVWFGFNALACAKGLAGRRLGRAGQVVYWCVDYVERRFGASPLTWAFERVDGYCCRRADLRIELSAAALEARTSRHGGAAGLAPARVLPMGAWIDRVPKAIAANRAGRKVVYLGHLVPRQGVAALLEAVALLAAAGDPVRVEIVGRGPLLDELQSQARRLGLAGRTTFHGLVPDHREVERIIAGGSVAVAPYATAMDSFTSTADPGKLKVYLAAGLPIVMTAVPPNARQLADAGAAELVDFEPRQIAAAIARALDDPAEWSRRHRAALSLSRQFDWRVLLGEAMAALGFD